MLQLAYLGPPGTFSEEAARSYRQRHHKNGRVELVPVRSIADLLLAVDRQHFDEGIVPVENSIEGPVVLTLDMLVHEVKLQIVAEEVVPIRHCLLTRPEWRIDDIQRVISHPQALAQCRRHLSQLVPTAELQAASSTAEAVQLVARGDSPAAAIGTRLAGQLYGLQVLYEDIQDVEDNATRFWVVSHRKAERTGYDKTSAVFAFPSDKPGNLYAALGEFARRNINLTKLESRPAKRSLGDYIFFIDMEGHQDDPEVWAALQGVEKMSSFFRILGSYPRAPYSGTA